MITIKIIEDHKMIAESLSLMLNRNEKIIVTAQLFDIKSARKSLEEHLPDVLLLDVGLPDGNGLDFCRELLTLYPQLKIIIYTNYTECNVYKVAMKYQAKGFVLKNCEFKEILSAIETVHKGGHYVCTGIEEKCNTNPTPAIILTPREKEILEYLARGMTTKQIAKRIFRSIENVNSFRDKLFFKFDVKNVAELIKKAMDCGYL
ncbi:MAG: response regulator transcription factor [Tannerella sp.]|jgi:DNA-binding NarL/FixJ family response regulator|nr:response regulator transcription factor [Tannerella sp.]